MSEQSPNKFVVMQEVTEFMRNQKSPVWNAADISYSLYHASTNTTEYRRVLSALHELKKRGVVGGENWPGANNVTVWWLTERLK